MPANRALLVLLTALASLAASAGRSAAAEPRSTLANGLLTADFEAGQLVRLRDAQTNQTLEFSGDTASLTLAGQPLRLPDLKRTAIRRTDQSLAADYDIDGGTLQVVYELKPGWRFITKHLILSLRGDVARHIDAVEVFRAQLNTPALAEHRLGGGSRGAFLRFGPAGQPPRFGAFLVLQNPFMKWERREAQLSMAYAPDMPWRSTWGPFASDAACIGLYPLSGHSLPAQNIPEWKYILNPEKAFDNKPSLDLAEIEALSRCVAAFVPAPPAKSIREHVPWCENDYQIDVATPAGRAEYKRIIDQAAAVGCQHLLFTPENSTIAPRKDNTDAWAWENVLWLGLGQKIRRGEWDPDKDPVPPTVQEMLDYAKSKNIRLMAYVYPTLGFKQNPEWTAWCQGKTGGYVGADTGVRSFQDWLVDRLVAFHRKTGVSGFCFDHWWIAYDKASSKYAQWYGCRRVLLELRRRIPDVVIDGRQQYHWFGPWTWIGGSFPHPMASDEQPGSYENFPDLHFDRVSANRQRFAAWWYRVEQFTPIELLPGFMTHQTQRNNARGQSVRDEPFRTRDWDQLGWRYSVISSIGTAPLLHVVNMLPARDEQEFKLFPESDRRWLRDWLDWTDAHAPLLRKLRPIIGPPMLGRIDGTAACDGDRGFIFLFNPNYRQLDAEFPLDATIGLTAGQRFALRELHPHPGRLIGKPGAGLFRYGDRITLPLKGPQAMVLEIIPETQLPRPALLNAHGEASLDAGRLSLSNLRGEAGAQADLAILLPSDQPLRSVSIDGAAARDFSRSGDVVRLPIRFAGEPFGHCPQIGAYDPQFAGKSFKTTLTLPARIPAQLRQRRQQWPINYTEDDLAATWLGSDRLLLFIHIADPDDQWKVDLSIDGKPIPVKKAYGSIYAADSPKRTFLGFYADLSTLQPGVHELNVTLPDLQPGQFQGLFLENIEAEFTAQVAQ